MVWGVDLHEHGADSFGLGSVEVVADERLIDDDAEFTAVAKLRVQGAGFRRVAINNLL